MSEINRLRAVVAEIIEENLTLKRGSWCETAPTLFQGGEKGLAGYGGESAGAE